MRTALGWSVAAMLVALNVSGLAYAKIVLTPEQQAKAVEAKAKAAEAAKHQAEALVKAQDRAVENYRKGKGKATASAAPAGKK